MDNLLAVIPSILGLGLFFFVIRLMTNADRLERDAEARMDAEERRQARAVERDEEPGNPQSDMKR